MTLPFISYGGSSALAHGDLRRHAAGADARACRPPGGGVMAELRARLQVVSSRPAAPAGMCSRPRRWPASSRRAACRSRWSPTRAAGSGRAHWRAGRSTTSIRRARPARCSAACWRCCRSALAWSMPGARSAASIRGRGRLRRLRLGADHARRPPAPACPRCCTSRTPCWARPTAWCWAARRAVAHFVRPRPAALEQDDRARLIGNPVRSRCARSRTSPYRAPTADRVIDLLVFGGSQGARVVQPGHSRGAFCRCQRPMRAPAAHRAAVPAGGSRSTCASAYLQAGIVAELAPFFADCRSGSPRAHLVIARSGASTVAELAAIGRPAILVPYPYAADDHQTANARAFEAAGACS